MQIKIKATHISLTPEIEGYIHKKLETLERLIPEDDTTALLSIEVGKTTEHHKTGDVFRAEFNLSPKGKTFYAFAEEADLYTALDRVKDELMHELRTRKDKDLTMFRRGGQKIKQMLRGFYRGKE